MDHYIKWGESFPAALTASVVLLLTWAGLAIAYGWPGFLLGWLPAALVGSLAGWIWPVIWGLSLIVALYITNAT